MPPQMQALTEEILDTSKLGKRGEGWFVAQLLLILLVLFPPQPLEVRALAVIYITPGGVPLCFDSLENM